MAPHAQRFLPVFACALGRYGPGARRLNPAGGGVVHPQQAGLPMK
jgi:hypothetical protein